MRAVVQRVRRARVEVDDEVVGEIGSGLLVLVGVTHGDGSAEVEWMARKIAGLRIFADDGGQMNLSAVDVGGRVLVVSQFTLYGDVRKGRRPSFVDAAPPDVAEPLIDSLVGTVADHGLEVAAGRFGASMQVHLQNDGPVTLVLDSPSAG